MFNRCVAVGERVRLIIVTIMSLFKAWRSWCSACYFRICFERGF
ncbi:hypothetical protein T4B_1762 [Trichinella pseudospiralis]|uniref:Uncharacterized protein n=1 Tax=Trichinella pseudospiralis TaxID=6337 RepID=A0A0V1GMQ9_TRIPS|nr:hypothetical protein T4B_1762 [Trichinella pseudospiralis]KRY99369.1 hypothetical protein T4C_8862 [Trichinella pseudospiralis]KRY99388.1 hypothetical protein T4C_4649 [Trichinella pseudospiralis]